MFDETTTAARQILPINGLAAWSGQHDGYMLPPILRSACLRSEFFQAVSDLLEMWRQAVGGAITSRERWSSCGLKTPQYSPAQPGSLENKLPQEAYRKRVWNKLHINK